MIRQELLAVLVCPESREPLQIASNDLVEKINQGIQAGEIRNRAGQYIEQPISGGLVREDRKMLYIVRDGIPVMLTNEGIPLGEEEG